ncbi:AfsR/SARP family transcriptional regulator [Actinocorallia populi]|uniref:AfsR/SARP family transcriptional regulator n=1 Tax=Actinocorallia populi TaxID=2079200 RepID=UPI000D08F564|nr:BTAD domain-containing putative transcriptional regulator [Actinocorallia populi]
MEVSFGVLGPVAAWDAAGRPIGLKGPRHRAVLARLIVARGRVVPVPLLAEDLWEDPPAGAVSAIRTFVGALRRALEPERPPRAPARTLVTRGPGYALRAEPDAVDAWRFERAVEEASKEPPRQAATRLEEALGWWRGPAYAEFTAEPWAAAERTRLAELRLHAVELRAEALLAAGPAAEAVPDLDAHVTEHPWRENAWRLLALALYRAGRQGDALAVLRRARTLLAEQLGIDPGPALRRLEEDILRQAERLSPEDAAERVWTRAAAAYDRTVASGARIRLESTVGLLRTLAITGGGGLEAAREHRLAAITAAEELGDPELTARVIGAYDVPALWTRPDDPRQAAQIIAAAERTLASLPPATPAPPTPHGPAQSPDTGAADEREPAQTHTTDDIPPAPHEPARTPDAGATGGREPAQDQAPGTPTGGHETARTNTMGDISDIRHRAAPAPDSNAAGGREIARTHMTDDMPGVRRARGRVGDAGADDGLGRGGGSGDALFGRYGAVRARLLATIAVESRGVRSARGAEAALEAERIARELDDPALLAFALNGVFMQSFRRAGLAPRRDGIGAELVALGARHGLVTFEVLGHLVRLQALGALGDFPAADRHALAVGRLAGRHEIPLVGIFTEWYRVLRLAADGRASAAEQEDAYRAAARLLDGAGMPGLADGLLPLALLSVRLRHALPLGEHTGLGPYEPWVRPLVLLEQGRRAEAAAALREAPEPPPGLLLEALWCLLARAAVAVGDTGTMERALHALSPASAELAGAGSGLLTLGPVSRYLDELTAALRHHG